MIVKKWRVALVVIGIIFLVILFKPAKKVSFPNEVAQGREKLSEMSSRDLVSAETSVNNAQKLKRASKRESLNYRQVFENTVIMGDSMAMALLDYQLLNPNQVVSKRGRTISNNEEDVAIVKGLSPRALFLQYGLNDMPAYRGDTTSWIADYEALIKDLQNSLPNMVIYIVAITPITVKGQSINDYNAHYSEFNDALKQMCERLHIYFIDTGFLVNPNDESQYQADGVHPGYDYFPKWLGYMADEAEL